VQHDEIADPFGFGDQLRIVRIDVRPVEIPVGKMLEQLVNTAHHHMDAGGFQRLQKTGGKPQCDAVAIHKRLRRPVTKRRTRDPRAASRARCAEIIVGSSSLQWALQ